jgi:hypothetical protein
VRTTLSSGGIARADRGPYGYVSGFRSHQTLGDLGVPCLAWVQTVGKGVLAVV